MSEQELVEKLCQVRCVFNYSLRGGGFFSCVPHVGKVSSVSITFIQATHTTHTRNTSKMA